MYDIAIFGAGPSGLACAYTSAKLGKKVLLVEKNNFLGGQMTGGLVAPVMKSESANLNTDFYEDLVLCANKFNAQITYCDNNKGWFNPVVLKIVLDDLIINSGVDILFESKAVSCKVYKKNIKSLEIKSKSLSIPIESKYYVDATGDGNLAELLGCTFLNDEDTLQPSSLRFIMSGVDMAKLESFLLKHDEDRNVTNSCITSDEIHLTSACTWDNDKNWGLSDIFDSALKEGVLMPFDCAYFQIFTIAGSPASVAFNCPRMQDYNPDNPFEYSKALIEARKAIQRISEFVKKYFDGFQNAYISNIASITGTRVSRRVKTQYFYTYKDIIESKEFNNPVLYADYPIDVHSNFKDKSVLRAVKKYSLPYESLVSYDYDNLFVTGRHIGVDLKAQAALRVQKTCMSMGEGLAKRLFSNNIN